MGHQWSGIHLNVLKNHSLKAVKIIGAILQAFVFNISKHALKTHDYVCRSVLCIRSCYSVL